jgi:ribulose-phosphate 3-epimerase
MEIVPAILEKNFSHIKEKIEKVCDIAKTVQIDVCDGLFVPSTTWPYGKSDSHFEAILKEEEGMPGWDKVDFEFDLMVKNPDPDYVRKWVQLGASRIVLHAESSIDLSDSFAILSGVVDRGLAIKVNTPIEQIEKYSKYLLYVQIMGIDKVGFQGQHLNQDIFLKIKEVKERFPDLLVQVDGGINSTNAGTISHAGADRLVIGSALFNSTDIVDTYKRLERI